MAKICRKPKPGSWREKNKNQLRFWQSSKLDVGKHFENYWAQRTSRSWHSEDGGQVISDSKPAAANVKPYLKTRTSKKKAGSNEAPSM